MSTYISSISSDNICDRQNELQARSVIALVGYDPPSYAKVVKETKKTDCVGARRCLLKYKGFMSLFLSFSFSS